MAIYTQYGRYLKAKMFKEMLEEQGDTYMLFGIGDPSWDSIYYDHDDAQTSSSGIKMSVAPYDTSIMTKDDEALNPFYNNKAIQAFISENAVEKAIAGSSPTITWSGEYANLCKNLLPPFPCVWNSTSEESGSGDIWDYIKHHYENCYIYNDTLHVVGESSSYNNESITMPTGDTAEDSIKRQLYSDLYNRGLAVNKGILTPVGLLGAVKCDISFVKDIGSDGKSYTGDATQFWYGDRYWEIVYPERTGENLEDFIDDENNKIYPHHLLFNTLVTPRLLCDTLHVDQNLVPRQIAIFTRRKKESDTSDTCKNYYRVSENIFNFGQYYQTESNDPNEVNELAWTPTIPADTQILNFTLKCNIDGRQYPDGDFKFILHDYIRGAVRDKHSADRFGYVVGF